MRSITFQPRAIMASAISDRWQRHGTASAHMMAVGRLDATSMSCSNPAWKAGVCM